MNRIVIQLANLEGCPVCGGGERRLVRVDLHDYEISAFLPCPLCQDPSALADFVSQSTDYLGGTAPPEVIA